MQIQIITDSNIEVSGRLAHQVASVVRCTLDRFSAQVKRVEVHLSGENSEKKFGAEDKRCLLEASLAGLQSISVVTSRKLWSRPLTVRSRSRRYPSQGLLRKGAERDHRMAIHPLYEGRGWNVMPIKRNELQVLLPTFYGSPLLQVCHQAHKIPKLFIGA